MGKEILINDVTLREAGQVISLTIDEKIQIAHALDELGIPQIQVGIPGLSEADKIAVAKLKKENVKARLDVLSFTYRKEWKENLDACIESGADCVDLGSPFSNEALKSQGMTKEEATEINLRAINYAKSQGMKYVCFSPAPTAQVNISFLKELIPLAVGAVISAIIFNLSIPLHP